MKFKNKIIPIISTIALGVVILSSNVYATEIEVRRIQQEISRMVKTIR